MPCLNNNSQRAVTLSANNRVVSDCDVALGRVQVTEQVSRSSHMKIWHHAKVSASLSVVILLALSHRILCIKFISCEAACHLTRAVLGLFYDGDDALNGVE